MSQLDRHTDLSTLLAAASQGDQEAWNVITRNEDTGTDAVDPEAAELDTGLLESERDAQLWACYAQLPDRCQQLLRVLMACDRPVYADVAEAFDMPIGSIGPTRMRCLERLRRLMDESGYTFDGQSDRQSDRHRDRQREART